MVWTEGLVVDEEYWAQWPEVLSISDLARITRKGEQTAWRWLSEGKIPAHRVAGAWIVYREEFQHRIADPEIPYTLPIDFLARYPEELTVAELSELLGKTRQTVWRWLGSGKLPGLGKLYEGYWLLYKHELVNLLEQTTNQNPPTNESSIR